MPEFNEKWIEDLAAGDPAERAKAALEIYRLGRVRADTTVHWWQNPEIAKLCGSQPEATVGLAVNQESFAQIRAANDFPQLADVPREHDAIEFELHFDNGAALDILTARDPQGSGAIAKFLAKHGQGVQQVEFRCTDVDHAAAILREQFQLAPVYPQKRPGANNTRVNFFLVTALDGCKVLIELYELHSKS